MRMWRKHKSFRIPILFTVVWVFVLSVALIANAVEPVNLSVTGITATSDVASNWTPSGNTIQGTISAVYDGCEFAAASTTLTLANSTGQGNAQLSFDYKISGTGTVTIAGSTYSGEGSYTSAPLNADGAVVVEMTSGGSMGNEINISLSNINIVVVKTLNVTFVPVNSISYTVGGKTVSETTNASFEQKSNVSYTLTCNTDNYHFSHATWVSTDGTQKGTLTPDANGTFYAEESGTITPVFVYDDDGVAPFRIGSVPYWSWEAAFNAAANGTIVLNSNYTLPTTLEANGLSENGGNYVKQIAGKVQYSVPSGAKFLIPCEDGDTGAGNFYASHGDSGTFSAPTPSNFGLSDATYKYYLAPIYDADEYSTNSTTYPTLAYSHAYRTLTVPANTKIEVKGEMNVNSRIHASDSFDTGCPHGSYGLVKLLPDGEIEVVDGGILDCFGFISGAKDANGVYDSGKVIAHDGAKVYECLQIRDWPLAGNVNKAINPSYTVYGNSFPLSQYYIQNIEATFEIHAGASTYGIVSINKFEDTFSSKPYPIQECAAVIGKTDGLFLLTAGYIEREYDPEADRIHYALRSTTDENGNLVEGSFSLNKLYVQITGLPALVGTITLDSSQYVLGLNSNISIEIGSNCTGIIDADVKLMRGAQVHVEEDGELTVSSGKKLIIYDVAAYNEYYTRWARENFYLHENPYTIDDNRNTQKEVVRYSHARADVFGADTPVKNRTYESAKLRVDGTLTAYGNIYTVAGMGTVTFTASGEEYVASDPIYTLKSSTDKVIFGTGTFINNTNYAAYAEGLTYYTDVLAEYYFVNGSKNTHVPIPCTPVVGFISTAETPAPTEYSNNWDTGSTYYGFYQDTDGDGAQECYWTTTRATLTLYDENGSALPAKEVHYVYGTDLSNFYTDTGLTVPATNDYQGETLALFANAEAKNDWASGVVDTYYETLKLAVMEATHTGDKVILLKNATIDAADKVKVSASQNITIDLNGKTVTYLDSDAANISTAIDAAIDNYGTLNLLFNGATVQNDPNNIVTDSKSMSVNKKVNSIVNQKGGVLTLDLGGGKLLWKTECSTVEYFPDNTSSLVYNKSGGVATIDLNGGTMEINCSTGFPFEKYRRTLAIQNGGTMTLTDAQYGTETAGVVTTNIRSTSKSLMSASGQTNYASAVIYNSGNLTMQSVKVTNTQPVVGSYSTCVYNSAYDGTSKNAVKLTMINVTLENANQYCLMNTGEIDQITGCTLEGYNGILNYNNQALSRFGIIAAITDTKIDCTNQYAIYNGGRIYEISGTTKLHADSGSTVCNSDQPKCALAAGQYVYNTPSTAEDGSSVTTYDWTYIPTIDLITGSVEITAGAGSAILNKGNMETISGSVKIGGDPEAAADAASAIALSNGGRISTIKDNVSITGDCTNGISISGKRTAATTTLDGVTTTTYACISGIDTISGSTAEGDAGVSIKAVTYGIYSEGIIDQISGKTTITATTNAVYLINGARLNEIGGEGSNVSISAKYGLNINNSTVGLIGVENDVVEITGTTQCIRLYDNALIGIIGGNKSDIELTSNGDIIYMYEVLSTNNVRPSTLEVLGGEDSQITMTNNTGQYGIRIDEGGNVLKTLGAKNSKITITLHNTTRADALYVYADSKIEKIGEENATVVIKAIRPINLPGTIGSIGCGKNSRIELIATLKGNTNRNYGAIHGSGTIGELGAGVFAYLDNTVGSTRGTDVIIGTTINRVSGGYYCYLNGGRDDIFSTGADAQKYPTGANLSSDTVIYTAIDGTEYPNCYYISYPVTFDISHNLGMQDKVLIGYWVNAEAVDNKVSLENAEYGMLVWTEDQYMAETNYTVSSTVADKLTLENRMDAMHSYITNGILAQNLDTRYYAIPYVKIGDAYYYGGSPDIFSVPMYAELVFAEDSTQPDVVKNAVRDLLNYGTYAKYYFGIRNEGLDADQISAINSVLPEADQASSFTDSMLVTEALTADKTTGGSLACTWQSTTINLEEAIHMNFLATQSSSFTKMLYWDVDAYEAAETLTAENMMNSVDVADRTIYDATYSAATITPIYAKDVSDPYYACMYDGTNLGSTVRVDSVAYYLTRLINEYSSSTVEEDIYLVQLCKNLLAYGQSAKAYEDYVLAQSGGTEV